MWILAVAAAFACDGPDRKVVGFTPTGDRVLVRLECRYCSPALTLRLLSIPTGSLVKEWTILDSSEQGDKVRGERWKAAESELVALGVKVDAELKPLPGEWGGPWTFGSWKVRVERDKVDEGEVHYNLMVSDGTREVKVRQLARGMGIGNDPTFAHAFLAPGGQSLVLQDIASCGQRDEVPVTADELRAALR
jgi:hypothetical protein